MTFLVQQNVIKFDVPEKQKHYVLNELIFKQIIALPPSPYSWKTVFDIQSSSFYHAVPSITPTNALQYFLSTNIPLPLLSITF